MSSSIPHPNIKTATHGNLLADGMAITNAQGLLDTAFKDFHLALSSRLAQIPAQYPPTIDTEAFRSSISFVNEEGEVIRPSPWSMPPSEHEKRVAQSNVWQKTRFLRGAMIPHVALGKPYKRLKEYMTSIGEVEEQAEGSHSVRGRLHSESNYLCNFILFC